ncbi:MAG: PKD domain-containing protein [Candidatus Thermoplasmatota archaeon]|nr:PKD domain-containing protein [Candidatus Thermoplasmatota archaeon]
MALKGGSALSISLLSISFMIAGAFITLVPGPVEASINDSLAAGPPLYYDYRNYAEVKAILEGTESDHSEIAMVVDIGDSWETMEGIADRDILAIKISDNVAIDEDEPEVLIMSLHHAREWSTHETTLAIIENLTDEYGSDTRISWLVDNREIWIIPVVNPDGLDYSLLNDDMWRKNRRNNLDGTYGVDLNRNYPGSENGDPLGAWGGVGTSSDTSSDLYCGEYAFSEPETQAIRDLVLSHDFQIAFDFHSYGDDVAWPWGYTLDPAEDDDDLERIGIELAALNGYDAVQSSEIYPTTGDSLDWLYGGADVYSFLFEIGHQFNPDLESDVLGILSENVPPALLGIEIAGDREERAFSIIHSSLTDSVSDPYGFVVTAEITADRGLGSDAVELVYRVDGGAWTGIPMASSDPTYRYLGNIPSQTSGSEVEYYILASDLSGVELMSPRYSPYDVYSFSVLPSSDPPVADAGTDQMVSVGAMVTFDASGTISDEPIASYTWTFTYNGSEVVLTGESPTFRFWSEGAYIVVLNVTDESGSYDLDSATITVSTEAIPEFSTILVPVLAIVALFVIIRARRP